MAAVLWGTVGPAQVLAATAADPVALGSARLLIGGLLLVVCVPLLDRGAPRWWAALGDGMTWRWLVLAALSTAGFQAAFLSSVAQTGAALTTIVALGVAPPVVGCAARVLTAERLTRRWLTGTVAAIIGMALLLGPDGEAAAEANGVLLAVAAGVCFGVYTVASKELLSGSTPTGTAVSTTLVLAGLAVLPFASDPAFALTDGRSLALTAWLAVPGTAGAYMLFVVGLRRVPAAQAGTLTLAEPLVAAALGLLLLSEELSVRSTIGAAVLAAGLVVVSAPWPRESDGRPRASSTSSTQTEDRDRSARCSGPFHRTVRRLGPPRRAR